MDSLELFGYRFRYGTEVTLQGTTVSDVWTNSGISGGTVMQRREFLATSAAAALSSGLVPLQLRGGPRDTDRDDDLCCGPGYASPGEAPAFEALLHADPETALLEADRSLEKLRSFEGGELCQLLTYGCILPHVGPNRAGSKMVRGIYRARATASDFLGGHRLC